MIANLMHSMLYHIKKSSRLAVSWNTERGTTKQQFNCSAQGVRYLTLTHSSRLIDLHPGQILFKIFATSDKK